MMHKVILPFLLAGSLMAAASNDSANPRIYRPAEVESLTCYKRARVSELVAVPKPPEKKAPEKTELAETVRKAVGDRAKSLGKAYGMDMSGELGISGSDRMAHASYQAPDDAYFSLNFNSDGTQVTHALIQNVHLENATTPGQLEKRFAHFHRKAFGFDPPSTRPAEDRIRVERLIKENFAQWRVTVDGTFAGEALIRATPNPNDDRWNILGPPCPTASEVQEIADWLRKEPTKITADEAVAIAWKNWKAVRNVAGKDPDLQITCQLRKGWKEELEPWGVFGVISRDAKAWKNVVAVSDSPVPVFYEVKFTEDEAVSVLVDRLNGKVIRIHQGKTPW
jgi:hypothetical protein